MHIIYILVRLGLTGIVIALISLVRRIMIMKKVVLKRGAKNFLMVAYATIILGSYTLFYMFPVENLFITFDTPEAVYKYMEGNGEVIHIVNGELSVNVIAKNSDYSLSFKPIPKSEGGYKIPNIFTNSLNARGFLEDSSGGILVFKVNDTEDYYIDGIISTKDDEFVLTDNHGNKFYTYFYDADMEDSDNNYSCDGYIKSFSKDDYYLIINGKEVNIDWS